MSDETKMIGLFEALADDVNSLSDEELLAECRDEGHSPAAVAKRTRSTLESAVKAFKQRPLLEARRERERSHRTHDSRTAPAAGRPTTTKRPASRDDGATAGRRVAYSSRARILRADRRRCQRSDS